MALRNEDKWKGCKMRGEECKASTEEGKRDKEKLANEGKGSSEGRKRKVK